MSKTLQQYLSKATNYLYPTQNSLSQSTEKEKILAICVEHGLDERFLELVEKDSEWKELAEHATVEYFVDVPKHLDKEQKAKLPSIDLLKLSLGTVPAIKVTCESYI